MSDLVLIDHEPLVNCLSRLEADLYLAFSSNRFLASKFCSALCAAALAKESYLQTGFVLFLTEPLSVR